MGEDSTSIQIERETWRALNSRKENPSDTFDDVIQRLLDSEKKA